MDRWINRLNKTKIMQGMVLVGICLIATLLTELFYFNFYPFFHSSSKIEIYRDNGELTSNDSNKIITDNQTWIHIRLPEYKYYRKINIEFDNYKTQKYKVSWIGKDIYGREKINHKKDIKKKGYRTGVTNINEEVCGITIELYGQQRSNISTIKISNSVQLNRYRMVWIFSCFFIFMFFVWKRKWFKDKLHWVFIVLSLILCLNYWFIEDIMQSGWDENVHFTESYKVAMGEEAWNTKAIQEYSDLPEEIWANTYEEHRMIINHFNKAHIKQSDDQSIGREFRYKDILYLPYIILIKIFSVLGFSFYQMYFLSKLGSMLIYILVMAYTIKIAKTGKLFLTATGIMPTRLFINSTYNYDSLTVAFLTLGFVIWINEMLEKEKKISIKNSFIMVGSFLIGSMVKQVYIFFVLLILFLPKTKFKNPKHKKVIMISCLVISVIIGTVMVGPMLYKYANGFNMPGDWRGGQTNLGQQLELILHEPIAYLQVMITSIWKDAGEFLLGRFPYVNFAFHRRPGVKFCYITSIIMLCLFCLRQEDGKEKDPVLEKSSKVMISIIIGISVILIWTALYLSYTPVGLEKINGVQARYYAPLIYPLMCVIKNKRIVLKASTKKYQMLMIGTVSVLNLYCIYCICMMNWTV